MKSLIILAMLLRSSSAGHDFLQRRKLILNGHNVPKGRYPYFVSLDYHNGVVLAGVLVAPDVVLTAGHCFPKPNENVTARIGTYSLAHDIHPEQFEVIRAMRHPGWMEFAQGFSHDFSLFKLSGKATNNSPLATINRNASVPAHNGKTLQVLGLGWTNMSHIPSPADIVQVADLNYMPNTECQAIADPTRSLTYAGSMIDDTMFCATGGPKNERDACGWDSGGPVILSGADYRSDVVVGLVSWGIGCADPVFPSVYARISAGWDWIKATVCELSDDPPDVFRCLEKQHISAKMNRTSGSWFVVVSVAAVFGLGFWLCRHKKKKASYNEDDERKELASYGSIQTR